MSREHKKFERLFLFSEVAKSLSFTEAAESLGISRGYLSEQIRQLEKDFNQALLIRTTRSVKLTPQGEMILASMSQVKSALVDLDRQIRHDHHTLEGVLRITAPSQFTKRYLLPICQEFRQQYPNIEFLIDCSYTLLDLAQNDFDLAFRATTSPPQNMVAKKLFDYGQVYCASPNYLAKYGIPTQRDMLKKHLCLTASDKTVWTLNQETFTPKASLSVNDNHMLKDLALHNQGIIMVPEYLVDKEIAQGTLVRLFEHSNTPQSSCYMVHPQLIHQSVKLNTFMQFTLNWFKQHKS